ncbi:nucleotide disphospho-sugar-binding domain-containing protein [Actinophytocola oryzae]|uniref:UDP:flavonoid glycosyltransferase YjiC (YdhE family) n=1 Tax=Actinophytocola oryzae TaxID=502181 RepID=A0A4R7VH47_9PSEU|nr:nucleotide disphospho-sugar-binding domain-containing protein [Actinophytocola oryzae]TDV48650.1 UDP:flavonoid glycosyltransferase YjiC (YdhE family) [Actinophytocola oryzae]
MCAQPRVLFVPGAAAWGPYNALRAMAEVIRARNLQCVFAVDESFLGVAAGHGFGEVVYEASPPPVDPAESGTAFWAQWVRRNAVHFRGSTTEQLTTVIHPQWTELVGSARHAHPRLRQIIEEVRPELIVVDNVGADPSVQASGIPWVRSISANPLELADPDLPPPFSGYSLHDRTGWAEFHAEYARLHTGLHAEFNDFCVAQGAPPLEPLRFSYTSPWLNLYTYPEALDYPRPPGFHERWHRLDTVVRTGERPFHVDDHLPGTGPVIYLSLGSMGSLDTRLLQHLVDVVARTGHRTIVSMGPCHDEVRLGPAMYGEPFLPQPNVLPECDLIITHGGSNTLNEAVAAGLPMIVLPLFWDQYDNAQRVADLGLGVRMDTYGFDPDAMVAEIERLLAEKGLRRRLTATAESIRHDPGALAGGTRIADLAESLVSAAI